MEKTAGEVVPKLMSGADDIRDVSELMRLRLTDKAGGIPEVVRADDGAVGAIMEVIGWMMVPASGEVETMPEL